MTVIHPNEKLALLEKISDLRKKLEECTTDVKNLRAVNEDLRNGWDKTLEENIKMREKLESFET